MNPSLWQRIQVQINGRVRIGYEKREGWSGWLPIYLARCDKHGYFTDYPHSWDERLDCPECLKEEVIKNE